MQRRGHGWGAAALLAAAGLLAANGATAQQTHAGEYAQADINYGMQVYGETCVACHGPDGDAVDGVSLRSGQFRSAGSDQDLMRVISAGIPDTAMPPGDYTASELTGLVAYLRTMATSTRATCWWETRSAARRSTAARETARAATGSAVMDRVSPPT